MAENCPFCLNLIGTYLDDPLKTPNHPNASLRGNVPVREEHITQIRNYINSLEPEGQKTQWTSIDKGLGVRATDINSIRTAIEKNIGYTGAPGDTSLRDFLTKDINGDINPPYKEDWTDGHRLENGQAVRSMHIEEIRRRFGVAWEEKWVGANFLYSASTDTSITNPVSPDTDTYIAPYAHTFSHYWDIEFEQESVSVVNRSGHTWDCSPPPNYTSQASSGSSLKGEIIDTISGRIILGPSNASGSVSLTNYPPDDEGHPYQVWGRGEVRLWMRCIITEELPAGYYNRFGISGLEGQSGYSWFSNPRKRYYIANGSKISLTELDGLKLYLDFYNSGGGYVQKEFTADGIYSLNDVIGYYVDFVGINPYPQAAAFLNAAYATAYKSGSNGTDSDISSHNGGSVGSFKITNLDVACEEE